MTQTGSRSPRGASEQNDDGCLAHFGIRILDLFLYFGFRAFDLLPPPPRIALGHLGFLMFPPPCSW